MVEKVQEKSIDSIYETRDLGIVAYLHKAGFKIASVDINDRGTYIFHVYDPDKIAHELAVQFFTDECYRFDMSMKYVRMLVNEKRKQIANLSGGQN